MCSPPVPINELPDPRILPPWESIHNKSKRDKASLHFPSQKYNGSETLWRDYTRTCPPHSAARYQQDDYHFVSRQRESHFRKEAVALTHEDLCSNDPSLHTLHSQFYEDYRAVSGLFPAFSCATADGFGGEIFGQIYYDQAKTVNLPHRHLLSQSILLQLAWRQISAATGRLQRLSRTI